MRHTLLVDGNSIGHAAQNSNPLKSGEQETQAVFGTLRTLHAMTKAAPTRGARIIVFWDGESWRKSENSDYKANRDDDPEQARNRESYKQQRPFITRSLAYLGITQVSAANLEADDLISSVVRENQGRNPMTIISGDKDLWQLVGPNVRWHNPINYKHNAPKVRTLRHEDFHDSTQYGSPMAFLEGKALMGDASDNIAGVGGIGEKGAINLLDHWGSVKNMIMDVRENQSDAIPEHLRRSYRKKFVTFANNPEAIKVFAANKKLMNLIDPVAPAPEDKKVVKIEQDMTGFAGVCEKLGFVSILRALDAWSENFKEAA